MNSTGRAVRAGVGTLLFGAMTTAFFALPLATPAVAQADLLTCRTALEGLTITIADSVTATSCCYLTNEQDWYTDHGIAEEVTYRSGSRYIHTEACTGSIGASYGADTLAEPEDNPDPVEEEPEEPVINIS